MKAEIEAVLGHVLSAWRFRWQALACTWLVALIGWCAVYLMADQFESKAQIRFDSASVLKPLLQGIAVSADSQTQTDIMKRALLSKPTLEQVAKETGISERANSAEEHDRLLQRLSQEIRITGNTNAGLYSIAFVDRSPVMAQKVVEHLLDIYRNDSFDSGRADAERAEQFLTDRVNEYSKRLSDSERQLADFKKTHLGMMPGNSGDFFQRFQTEQLNVEKLHGDLDVAIRRRTELRQKLAGTSVTSSAQGTMPTPQQIQEATALDARLQDSRRQLDELLRKYTDKHPDVIALRQTILDLEERRRLEFGNVRATSSSSTPGGGASVDGVLQDLQIELNTQDGQVTMLQAQLEQSERRLTELRNLLSTGPEIERQLADLTRDNAVTKAQYDQLLQRLESAKISGDAEEDRKVTFKVLDPPRVPILPIAPRRSLFLGVVLLGAITCGMLLAFVLSQAKPVFFTVSEIGHVLGAQVVGTIGRMRSMRDREVSRRSRLAIVMGAVALVATFAAAVHYSHPGSAWLRGMLSMDVT